MKCPWKVVSWVFFVGHKLPVTIAFLYLSYESVAKLTTYEKPLFLSVLLTVNSSVVDNS